MLPVYAGNCIDHGLHDRDNYGQVVLRPGLYQLAHYHAYEAEHGIVPDGHTVDHLCRNKRCINPAHLEAVTAAENSRRNARALWDAKGVTEASLAGRTLAGPDWDQCVRGHPATSASTFINRKGYKVCRTCSADSRRGTQQPRVRKATRRASV